ncbi:hypothetical protein ACFQ2Y_44350 [Streptomyces malaysiensis subsp. malaysiensis]
MAGSSRVRKVASPGAVTAVATRPASTARRTGVMTPTSGASGKKSVAASSMTMAVATSGTA